MIKQSTLDKIYNTADIVDVIGSFVQLSKAGSLYKGKSPWNTQEKTPSFVVNPAKNIYKDFGASGYGGNVVDFLMKKENLTYPQALQWLAEKYKIEIEYENDQRTEEEKQNTRDKWQKATEVINLCSTTYTAMRKDAQCSAVWNDYITSKGWTEEQANEWGVGIVPNKWDTVKNAIIKNDLYAVAEEIGVVKRKEGESSVYDKLRARITFEIKDTNGKCVGFAGRDYTGGEGVAKYLNPSDSFIYNKSKVLYGWQFARLAIRESGVAYLVEGYTDVIAMHRMGMENTVGSCGTSVTEHQLRLIHREQAVVCVVMEDAAGKKSAMRTVAMCVSLGIGVLTCDISHEGKKRDCDDLATAWQVENGVWHHVYAKDKTYTDVPDWFKKNSTEGVRWWADEVCAATLGNPGGKQKVVNSFATMLSHMPEGSEVMRDEYAMMMAGAMAERAIGPKRDAELAAIDAEMAQTNADDVKNTKRLQAARAKTVSAWEKKLDKHEPGYKDIVKWASAERDTRKGAAEEKAKRVHLGEDENPEEYLSNSEVKAAMGAENLPDWVDAKELRKNGMVQLREKRGQYTTGLYFPRVNNMMPDWSMVLRCTNFTIDPLYHVVDLRESHRMVKMQNDDGEQRIVELSDKALSSFDAFSTMLTNMGNYTYEPHFNKYHFIKLKNYILRGTERCMELKHLGWNGGGFYAFSNVVCVPGADGIVLHEYDHNGIVKIGKKLYLSPSMAPSRNLRDDDGADMVQSYEEEKFFTYTKSSVDLTEWARLFVQAYGHRGEMGFAWVLVASFRDLIYQLQLKCPHLYLFGPPQSGKSAMGESILRLFFSGKNTSGQMKGGVAMGQGMVTDFALADSLERFRNAVFLGNEYDPYNTDKRHRAWFKNAFDNEGRKKGSIGEGRTTVQTQHVNSAVMLSGQLVDQTDGCALLTRCVNLSFSERWTKDRSDNELEWFHDLKHLETEGLSSVVMEIMGMREVMQQHLKPTYMKELMWLREQAKRKGGAQTRLMENYALMLAVLEVVKERITLPVRMDDFRQKCVADMVEYSGMVTRGGVLSDFWNAVMMLYSEKEIVYGKHIERTVKTSRILLTAEGEHYENISGRPLIMVTLTKVINVYQESKRRAGQHAWGTGEILDYLKHEPYFLGIARRWEFNDTSTSAAILDEALLEGSGVWFAMPGTEGRTPQPAAAADGAGDIPF
jgi:DNA primase catalytic core